MNGRTQGPDSEGPEAAASDVTVLIVDGDPSFREALSEYLDERGLRIRTAGTVEEALDACGSQTLDVALVEAEMLSGGAVDLGKRFRDLQSGIEIIAMTGRSSDSSARETLAPGTFGIVTKPVELAEVARLVSRASEHRRLRVRTDLLQKKLAQVSPSPVLVGESLAIRRLREQIRKVAPAHSNVLIQGPTGSGSKLVAQAIHLESQLATGSFVVLDCGALQKELQEDALVGRHPSANEGESVERCLLEQAHRGTLFVDAVEEMAPALQLRFQRVLESGVFRRLGSSREIPIDFRVIGATTCDLEQAVASGEFLGDLFYLLDAVRLQVPPLAERREDIPHLVRHVLETRREAGGTASVVAPEALETLQAYGWPGNVRELTNAVEYAALMAQEGYIRIEHLPERVRRAPEPLARRAAGMALGAGGGRGPLSADERPSLAEIEKRYILETMVVAGGNRTQAARILQISVRNLARKLQAYGYPSGRR